MLLHVSWVWSLFILTKPALLGGYVGQCCFIQLRVTITIVFVEVVNLCKMNWQQCDVFAALAD